MKKILRYLSLLLTTGSVTTLALSALSAQDLQQYNPARNQVQKDAGLLGGEGGQVLQALAVSSDASLLIVGSDVAGLRRSENQGELWQPANAGYTPRGNVALAIDPNNADRVIALGGNSRSSIGTPVYHGIYLSTDRGVSWQQVLAADICGFRDIREQLAWDASSLDTNLGGSAVAYWSRMDTSFCQAGGSEIIPGLYKTTDGGQNWALLPNSGNYSQSTIKIHPTEGFVYAARADGFYKSTDGGLSFTLKEEGEMKGLDVVATQPDRVYLSKPDGVYVSEDAGENFTKVDATNFPDESSFLKVSPANPDKMMMQVRLARFDTPWYYSHDGGVSWTPTVMDTTLAYLPFNGGRRIYPVWHPTDEDVVWAIGGDWVTKSTDGGQTLRWSNQGSSMIAQSGYFAFSPYNPDIVAITNQDYNSSYTTDGGDVWKYLQTSAFGFGGFAYGGFAPTEDIVFVRDAQQARGATTLVISSDGGDTFDRTQIPVEGAEVGYADPLNEQTYFLGNLRSGDGGDTWQPMDGCQGVFTHNRANPEELFGVDDTRLVRSLDGGQNWEVVFNVTTPLWDIAHDQVNDKFFAVSEFKFYAYQRTSNTLTDITARTPKDQLGRANRYHTVAVDPVETNVVYVGNHRDIYASDVSLSRSLNGGQSWKPLTPAPRHGNLDDGAIGGYEVQCVRVHPVTREVWIGGSTYGIWKYPPPGPDAAGPPTARLTSPTSGTIVQAPGEVVLAAEAQDEDGSIVRVEFFVDKQKIGETDTAPYSLTWNVENPGLYNLQVVAVDNDGTFTDTTEIAVEAIPKESYSENFDDGFAQGWTVLNGDWQVEDQRYQSPEPTSAKIAVFDSIAFGSYTYQVEAVPSFGNFFGLIFQYQDADNYYLLKIDGSPNDISLEKVENGTTTVVAASTYPQGGQGTSNAIAVVYNRGFANVRLNDALIFSGVNMGAFRTGRIGLYADFNPVQFDDLRIDPLLIDGVPPQVAISFPPTDTVFNDPASFTITAEANDPDGEVARVVFQINGNEVGEDTEAPYTYTTNALGTGDYVLEAIATDSDSLATISQSVSIQVFPEGTYRENFDDGRAQGWQSISGNWIVEDSAYRTTDVTGGKRAVYQGTTFENYIYQLDAFPSFGNDFGVLFQYQDTDNYYRLRLDANPRTASLEKIQDGSVIEIATTTYPTGGERTNNAIAVTYESGLTSVSINDTLVFDQVSTPDSTSGKIGLYGDFNPVSFDNIRVEAIRRVEALVVVAECSENSDTGRSWSIVNPNRQPIPYTWHLLDTSQQGDSLAQSGENRLVTAVGDAFVITWEDEMGKIQIDTAYTNEVAEPSLSRPRPFIIPLHRSDSSQVIRMQSRQSLPTLVVVSTEPIKAIPQDGTNYLSDLVLSAGDSIASGTYVVWVDSTGNEQFTVTGLSPRTRYYAAAYVFASGNGCGPNYLERRVATTRFRTLPSRPCPIPRSTVLYPNPSSGQLTIKAGACAQELLTVTLVGKTGQASVLGTYLLEPGFTNLSFDLSDQLDGTYLVELQSSVRRQVRRWVKQE